MNTYRQSHVQVGSSAEGLGANYHRLFPECFGCFPLNHLLLQGRKMEAMRGDGALLLLFKEKSPSFTGRCNSPVDSYHRNGKMIGKNHLELAQCHI